MKTILNFIQFVPIWIVLTTFRLFPIERRSKIVGAMTARLVNWLPHIRRRSDENLIRAFPDLSDAERRGIRTKMGRHIGQTLSEILFNQDYQHQGHRFHGTGDGLAAILQAHQSGKGAVIVSGHFGQWEAIRHFLKHQGVEVGAVYRPTNNPFYEARFLQGIKQGGEPIVPKGLAGMRQMIKCLRGGGCMAVLIDQRQNDGEILPFLGHPARTSLAAAELALKMDLPLVPVFAKRQDNGLDIDIQFELPIVPSDAVKMTRTANSILERRIRETPEQWFWVHKRWDDPRRRRLLAAQAET